jgi:antitoxin component YwqK of YwqJK toxin-antitoxin module
LQTDINGNIVNLNMNIRSSSSKYSTVDQLLPDVYASIVKFGISESLYKSKPCNFLTNENEWWVGAMENGIPNGNGILLISEPRKLLLVTFFKKGMREGKAKGYFEDGTYFDVMYKRNLYEGDMECYNSKKELLFRGEFLQHPLIKLKYTNGSVYVGNHVYFNKHGKGKLFKDNTQNLETVLFDGQWLLDKFVKGYIKSDFYHGETIDLIYDGQGTLYFDKECTKKKFQGRFKRGKYSGEGIEYNSDQTVKFEGFFEEGLYEGPGVLFEDNMIYRGSFHQGRAHGRIEIIKNKDILQQKALYTEGLLEKVQEEYFYDVVMPSAAEITLEEAKKGVLNSITLKKVMAFHESGTLKYFTKLDDITPCFIGQMSSIDFNTSYSGVISEGGTLFYIGELRQVYFSGKGTLRYNTRNEPKKYEGEFLNGYINGKGDLYYPNGRILYSGDFRANTLDGSGVLSIYQILLPDNNQSAIRDAISRGNFSLEKYNLEIKGSFSRGSFISGELKYKGSDSENTDRSFRSALSDLSSSVILKAKVYDGDYLYYEGGIADYTLNGSGVLYFRKTTQILYKGGFKDGAFHGKGELFDFEGNLVYKGDFENGAYHGSGILDRSSVDVKYIGEFQKGQIHGTGKMIVKNNGELRSEGYYEEGKLVQGFIKIYEQGNLLYEGFIKNGLYHGEGKVYTNTKQIAMEGEFVEGKLLNGFMREFFGDGSVFREGHIKEDLYEGHIKEYFSDGKILFDGYYSKGVKHGKGTLYHRNGRAKQNGLFKEGAFEEGEILLYYEDSQVIKIEGSIQGMYLNGPGKKFYESGILEYEGSFSQGQFSGPGKYYNPEGILRFEGIFSEGTPGGHGTLYDLESNVIYVGEMSKWKKNGSGTFYSKTGEVLQIGVFAEDEIYKGTGKAYWPGFGTLKYEGDYDNGFPEGTGTCYYPNGNLEYKGTLKFGKPHLRGVLYSETVPNLVIYEGEFLKGLYHGEGILNGEREIYEGRFKNGKKDGEGILSSRDSRIGKIYDGRWADDIFEEGLAWLRYEDGGYLYVGSFLKNKYHGEGTKYDKNGRVEYEGHWRNGLYHGFGKKYDSKGNLEYEGEYQQNHYHGTGKLFRANGTLIYQGELIKGSYNGKGTLYDENEGVVYQGHFTDGLINGSGSIYFPNSKSIKYSGEFKNGIFEGFGERFNQKGSRKFVGKFTKGKYNGEGVLYYPDGKTKKFVGTFKNKIFDKEGTLFDEKGGYIYKGGFLEGKYHGQGTLFFPGTIEAYYEGDFVNGQLEGQGIIRFQDGKIKYKGGMKGGKYQGFGELFFESGTLMCEGEFNNGLCCHGLHT